MKKTSLLNLFFTNCKHLYPPPHPTPTPNTSKQYCPFNYSLKTKILFFIGLSHMNSYNFIQEVLMNSVEEFNVENSNVSTISMADAKVAASNKSHSEAERRRRKRINGHLATLRNLLPSTIKADKASLLAEVVRSIKELKKATAENTHDDFNQNIIIPTETDELKLCYCEEDSRIMKASLCCDDRPEMMGDLKRALSSVEAKVVRAEMATIGGRTKVVLWLQVKGNGEEGMEKLRRALKIVIDKSILLPGHGQSLLGCKRPRLYHC